MPTFLISQGMQVTEEIGKHKKYSQANLGFRKAGASPQTFLFSAFAPPIEVIAVLCQFLNNVTAFGTFV